ncbi:hypothetical protein [Paenibacillus sp. QZ-Y1]|uniref:hypothetical protein n=1 Tax=Paenibacillus sp. QZ-Y1 TaxID=3414511 RepID=UPI003F7956AD
MKNRLYIILLVVVAIMLTGCEKDRKIVFNQTYIETISTQKGDIMIFKNSDGHKYGWILDPSDSFDTMKNRTYDIEVSIETITSYGGFIKGITEK